MKYLAKMLSVLTVATIVLSSAYAEIKEHQTKNYNQGHVAQDHQMANGYNSSARIDVEGAWDFYASADFIYWQPMQENLDLGITLPTDPTTTKGNVLHMDFEFKPGFKVGLGMHFDHDDWGLFAEYTWLHMSETKSHTPPTGTTLYPIWSTDLQSSTSRTKIAGTWYLGTNLFDLALGRPYYVGTKLVFKPSVGLRGIWMDQKMYVTNTYGSGTSEYDYTHAKQDTWGIAPRVTFDADYLLGCGFRLLGKSAFSLGYQYFKSSLKENTHTTLTTLRANLHSKVEHITINPEVGVGFGWGTYFDNNNWHFDISACYDFQVFLSQNMMKDLVGFNLTSVSVGEASINLGYLQPTNACGDLYFQGLTIKAQLDF
jgi:hypothetical protein